jgi:hypothetical protein
MQVIVNVRNITHELRKQFDALTGRQVAQAASSAINKTLKADRAMIGKEIRSVYNMGVFDAKSEIKQDLSTVTTLRGQLRGNAGFTPFEYFKISGENNITGATFKTARKSKYTTVNGKRKVSGKTTAVSAAGEGRHATFEVAILRNRSKLFTHAFIGKTKNGEMMLFNRGTYNSRTNHFGSISRRNPISRLRTLSVWQEMNNKKIVGKSEALLRAEYTKEFHRLLILRLQGHGAWR